MGHAGSPREIEDVRDILKIRLARAGDEQHSIRPHGEDFAETLFEVLPSHRPRVDGNGAVLGDTNDHFASSALAVRWLGNLRIQSRGFFGRKHHEDDDQDKKHVDHRGDIDLARFAAAHASMDTGSAF